MRSSHAAKVEKELVDSARALEQATIGVEEAADRRTQLAADRTVFAAERTYAAWVRSGLVAMASGIGAKKLLAGFIPEWMIIATASVLVAFSAFCFGAAVWREFDTGAPPPAPDTRRIHPWILVAVNGFLAVVALAALIGIWFGASGS
jgi:putative membrane protein